MNIVASVVFLEASVGGRDALDESFSGGRSGALGFLALWRKVKGAVAGSKVDLWKCELNG